MPLKLWWRGSKQPEYRAHWGERFGFYQTKISQSIIWLHCVSVGETRAAEPLIKALMAQYPNHQMLLTHGTPTGRETGYALFGNSILQAYLPYDTPFAVARFLAHFQPTIGIIFETELWFNLIAACKQRKIPLALVNARLSEKSANNYAKLGKLVLDGLQNFSVIAAQTQPDALRLQRLGAQNVSIMGNLKFDVSPAPAMLELGAQLRALFGKNRHVLLCASTREGEEALILQYLTVLKCQKSIQTPLLIIVPRHPQRFDEVAALLQQKNLSFVRRSQLTKPVPASCNIVLGDSMGELFAYYAACDVAFIGGSLLKLGGQNLIEALSVGKPVLVGPHTFNFAEATTNAITLGAAKRVANAQDLMQQAGDLLNDESQRGQMAKAALQFSQRYMGATNKAMQLIEKFLPN